MKFTAGDTRTIHANNAVLVVKIEDASKGDSVSFRVERVQSGENFQEGQVYQLDRKEIQEA